MLGQNDEGDEVDAKGRPIHVPWAGNQDGSVLDGHHGWGAASLSWWKPGFPARRWGK